MVQQILKLIRVRLDTSSTFRPEIGFSSVPGVPPGLELLIDLVGLQEDGSVDRAATEQLRKAVHAERA